MKDKKSNIIINMFAIICGLLHSCLIMLFPFENLEYNYQGFYFMQLIVAQIVFTVVFTIIKSILQLNLRLKSNITYVKNTPYYLYSIASAIGILIFTLLLLKSADYVGYSAIIFDVIINIIVCYNRINNMDTDYFYRDLYDENKNKNKNVKKQEIKCFLIGMVVGILSILPLVISIIVIWIRGKELLQNFWIILIAGVLPVFIFPRILEEVIYKCVSSIKAQNKNKTKKYWMLENIIQNAYLAFSSIGYFLILVCVIKLNIYFSLALSYFIVYLVGRIKLVYSYEPDHGGNISFPDYSYSSNEDIKVEKNIWGENVYKKNGEVVATGKFNVFGDEEIIGKDYKTLAIGKKDIFGNTNYTDNDYNNLGKKEVGFFSNEIKDSNGNVKYKEEKDFWGDSTLHKK